MALTQQDYKNIYSMLPTEKNKQGDSSLGLGKKVTNLIPPFEQWIDSGDEIAYFFMPELKGLYMQQFFPEGIVDVARISPLKQMQMSGSALIDSVSMPQESYDIRVTVEGKEYVKLSIIYSSNIRTVAITISDRDNNNKLLGSFTCSPRYDQWELKGNWSLMLDSIPAIYLEKTISNHISWLDLFFKMEDTYETKIGENVLQYIESKPAAWRIKRPGGFVNTKTFFNYRYQYPCYLHLCLFESDYPWVVDFNNTIVGANLGKVECSASDTGKIQKDTENKEIREWFRTVELEIDSEQNILYAINPFANHDNLSFTTAKMDIGGVTYPGVVKLIPNRLFLTSPAQNTNWVDTEGRYSINTNATRRLRTIYDKSLDTADNKANKGTSAYIRPCKNIYWHTAVVDKDAEKIALCTGKQIDTNIKDNVWADFRLLSKNDLKEENYTSIELTWVFIYDEEVGTTKVTKYLLLGKSIPIIINKESTSDTPVITKVYGSDYYENPYIFID